MDLGSFRHLQSTSALHDDLVVRLSGSCTSGVVGYYVLNSEYSEISLSTSDPPNPHPSQLRLHSISPVIGRNKRGLRSIGPARSPLSLASSSTVFFPSPTQASRGFRCINIRHVRSIEAFPMGQRCCRCNGRRVGEFYCIPIGPVRADFRTR